MLAQTAAKTQSAPFTRSTFTWLAYVMLAYFAYTQAGLGPAMPFLRAELGLSYTLGGLHVTAFAVGMVGAGLVGAMLAQRWGRTVIFWGGGGGMALGALLFILGQSAFVTVPASLVMGLCGTLLVATIQSTLSDHHGAQRATALTEANVAASLGTTAVPVLLGGFAATVVGWRGAFLAAVVACGVLWWIGRGVPVPAANEGRPADAAAPDVPLPRAFWGYWLAMVLCVAVEWSLITWSAEYLDGVVGLERELASALMSAFFVAMVIGRVVGSLLTRRMASARLLPVALGIALLGFLVFWLAPLPWLNVAGLFVAGLGIANLFPQGLAAAQNLAADQADRASARVALAAGLAILIAPQVLGTAADVIGLQTALGLIVVLLAAAMGVIAVTMRLRGK
ncbi:MAG: MFS transporter [Anaerolineae bacterium]|nr:MFS transporter [Anaerolineae bacterium]